MTLNQKIITERKRKGLTQEELAALTRVNPRTIQRIENGECKPREFTLKAIAAALGFTLTDLKSELQTQNNPEDTAHFLNLFCISCFNYLIIPYVHFLIPNYLLKKSKEQNPAISRFAQKVIRTQVYWVIATMLVFLIVLGVNFFSKFYLNSGHYISYLIPFFAMYLLNTALIINHISKARRIAVQMTCEYRVPH